MSKRILAVDDDHLVRRTLALFLKKSGFQAQTAASGMEALNWIVDHRFDVVITDVRMPEMDGFTFLETMREFHKDQGRSAPKEIILTGFNDRPAMESAERFGITHFLMKPFDAQTLLDALK